MAEHRVSMLAGSLHRRSDPTRSADPAIQDLLTQLRTLEVAPAPRTHFRAELRAQLVAVTPRLVAEGAPDLIRHTPASLEAARSQRTSPSLLRTVAAAVGRIRIRRPLGVVTTALAVLAVLLGGAVWVSHSSLPGDPLYGLKRASEDAQYSLTSGDVARSKELLSFAQTRAGEVSALLGQATAMSLGAGTTAGGGGVSPRTAALITSTLDSADQDIQQAAQMLGGQALQSRSAAPLSTMTDWTPGQATRMQSILARIPAGTLHDRAAASANLVDAAAARARSLAAVAGCACMSTARSDALGPIPCTDCAATQQQPSQPGVSTPGGQPTASTTAGSGQQPGSAGTGTGGTATGTAGAPTAAAPTNGATPTGGLLPSLQVPTLPITIPTTPLTTDTCGLGVSLGQLQVGVGTCGVQLNIARN